MPDWCVSSLDVVTGSGVTCRSAGLRYALSRMQRDSWWACKLSIASVTEFRTNSDRWTAPVPSPPNESKR